MRSSIWRTHEKLRGIYFIDPEDKEFKETIKNARKKLETPVAPVKPCKIMNKNCGSGASNKIKTRLACILEADESTRMRMGESLPNHHEDHIAGKGNNSLQHYNLVHKFIPMPQAMNAQIFVCVVTRSTTAEVQHNDMMMRTNVQNDLRHEMALEMWIVNVHEKSEQL